MALGLSALGAAGAGTGGIVGEARKPGEFGREADAGPAVLLALALGRIPNFPEQPFAYLWESKRLPPPSCHNGTYGLTALQEYEQKRTGLPFTFIGDWQNQVDQLLWQEENRHHPPIRLISFRYLHSGNPTLVLLAAMGKIGRAHV